MTALLILVGVLAPSAVFVAHRLWATRGRSPAEERAIRQARALAARIDQLHLKGE